MTSDRLRAARAKLCVAYLGTVSLVALANAQAAYAQPTDKGSEPVEEVLVTGSLIAGTQAVGVAVQGLTAEDFANAGAVDISDLVTRLPSIAPELASGATSKGRAEGFGVISIHNVTGNRSEPRELMMVDGARIPPSGKSQSYLNPTAIPTLAVERVDILPDGASATYGADAMAGVINIILKRGYDGARTMVRYGRYPGGGDTYQAGAVWGRTWDGGDVTLTYEWFDQEAIPASARPNMTQDYTPWGLENETPLGSSFPGIVSIGKPAAKTGTICSNCYSIPKGQNGVGLAWAKILANPGVQNEVNPYLLGNALQTVQRNSAVMTVDQRLWDGVRFFADGFYSNHRLQNISGAAAKSEYATYVVPTSNPYYPVGAPAGLQWTGSFGLESIPFVSGENVDAHYEAGLNLDDLPHGWSGKIYMAQTYDIGSLNSNVGHAQAVQAALGSTVAAAAPYGAFVKPANIPYLNPFCDETAFAACNPQSVIDFIAGRQFDQGYSLLDEKGTTFSGPLFALPGGEMKAAIGATYSHIHINRISNYTYNQQTTAPQVIDSPFQRNWWSVFTQVDIPLFGDANAIPLFRKLDLQASWRHDQYSDFGGTSNPKVALNWEPVEGLTIRGSWGTSFRAPSSVELGIGGGFAINMFNIAAGEASNTIGVICTGGKPVAGSAAAQVNPTCDPALKYAAGGQVPFSLLKGEGTGVGPEKGRSLNIGAEFAPTDFLNGLDVEVTYWKVRLSGAITEIDPTEQNFNDPAYAFLYATPASVGAAAFAEMVAKRYSLPTASGDPAYKTDVLWLADNGRRNIGYEVHDGIDFSARYDWDMSDQGLGAWDAGITGTYYLRTLVSTGIADVPTVDLLHDDLGAGAVAAYGVPSSPRYAYRAHLGWADKGWSVIGFFNYSGHYNTGQPAPPAAFLAAFPNYSNLAPEFHTWDLSVGYNTGETPTNDYLRHVGIQVVARNILDKRPPFQYNVAPVGRIAGPIAYDTTYPDTGRLLQLTVTKDW